MKSVEERYFHGTPCKRGHVGRRYRSTGACVECMAMHSVAKRAKAKALAVANVEGHEASGADETSQQLATA